MERGSRVPPRPGPGHRLLDRPDRLADPAEAGELPHPAQEDDDGQVDDHHHRPQQHGAPARPVEGGRQGDDLDHREHERAEDRGERVVRRPVSGPRGRGAPRHARRRGTAGVDRNGQREGRHRQHRGGEDAQDRAEGVGVGAQGEILLRAELEAPREQGRRDAADAVERRADSA